MAGDDLDDDYSPDALVALSDDEGAVDRQPLEGEEDAFIAGEEDDHGTPSSAILLSTNDADALKDKKRKRKAKDNERKAKVESSKLIHVLSLNGCCRNCD